MPTPLDQPAWLATAWAELGQHEDPGPATNPRIRDYYAAAGYPGITSDAVAWCAAFLSACLERAQIPSARTLLARKYLDWGVELTTPRIGAIAVLSRDPDPDAGHVGFLIGETGDHLILLGGNQSSAVTVQAFPKSRLLSLRWPAPQTTTATPTPDVEASALFDRALTHVLAMEGGYTNDPADPGGPTNFGITLADYARFKHTVITSTNRAELIFALQHISQDDVRTIYFDAYWRAASCPKLPAPLAIFHFDTAVNMGTGTALRMLQTALDCTVDGVFGPKTQAAAAAANPSRALAAYADLRRRRYRSLSGFPRFGRGWLSRVDQTLTLALAPLSTKGPKPMTDVSMLPASGETTQPQPKWWGESITIWGALVTGLAAVVPAIGPALGVDISAAAIHTAAGQIAGIAQAVIGLAGTFAAIYGRMRAKQPLVQRSVTLKL